MKPGKTAESPVPSEIANERVAAGLKANVLSQLSSAIAHEINNPLTIILGHAENLIAAANKGFVPAAEIHKSASAIIQSSLRVGQIVRGFRNFARDGSQDPVESTPFRPIFDRATALCRARFRNHDVELQLEPPAEDLTAFCRAHEMEQSLFYVLCVMFDSVLEESVRWVKISATDLNETIQIRIASARSGISDDVQMFLGSSQSRAAPSRWLGLAVAKHLIETSGGKLLVEMGTPSLRLIIEVPKSSELSLGSA